MDCGQRHHVRTEPKAAGPAGDQRQAKQRIKDRGEREVGQPDAIKAAGLQHICQRDDVGAFRRSAPGATAKRTFILPTPVGSFADRVVAPHPQTHTSIGVPAGRSAQAGCVTPCDTSLAFRPWWIGGPGKHYRLGGINTLKGLEAVW